MRTCPNPHLYDENKFKEIMKKASESLDQCLEEKYSFMNCESVTWYDMFEDKILSHVDIEMRKKPAYKLTILQFMSLIAMEEDKRLPTISWQDVEKDNVIDFMKYKQLKNQRK